MNLPATPIVPSAPIDGVALRHSLTAAAHASDSTDAQILRKACLLYTSDAADE